MSFLDIVTNPVASVAGSAIGAGLSMWGQSSANEANKKMAREQMQWSERMSNTSWQRAVADMKKAGINPMVAFSQGGAGTPTPSGTTAQSVTSDMPRHIANAMDALRMHKELELLQTQIDSGKSSIDRTNAERDRIRQDIHINEPTEAISDSWLGKIAPYFVPLAAAANTARAIGGTTASAVKGYQSLSQWAKKKRTGEISAYEFYKSRNKRYRD